MYRVVAEEGPKRDILAKSTWYMVVAGIRLQYRGVDAHPQRGPSARNGSRGDRWRPTPP